MTHSEGQVKQLPGENKKTPRLSQSGARFPPARNMIAAKSHERLLAVLTIATAAVTIS
jgi:hypothetical protein